MQLTTGQMPLPNVAQAIALVFQQHFATITAAKKAHRRGEILLDSRVTRGMQTCATP